MSTGIQQKYFSKYLIDCTVSHGYVLVQCCNVFELNNDFYNSTHRFIKKINIHVQ